MPHQPSDRHDAAAPEVLSDARLIAGGLAALGMTRDDVVAVLLHNDPVYLSIAHACRIAGCRIRQVSPHATREQIGSALAEPGIRAMFIHEYFLPVLAEPAEDIAVIAVTPLSLFPGGVPGTRDGRPHFAYHQWLAMQEERSTPLRARRGRRCADGSTAIGSAAVGSKGIGDCQALLAALIRDAGAPPPPSGGASPHSAGTPEPD